MSEELKFNIGDEAVKTIIDLRDQEPGDKEYALFLQIDGVHGNQFTYDLSFLDIDQARSDDRRVDFGDLIVIIAAKDVEKFDGASLDMSEDPDAPGLTMDNPNTPSPAMIGNPADLPELKGELAEKVQAVLENQINPAIASHGGAAQLIGVEGNDIYLRLGGGCQGCGMAQVTLTQGIEASLREAVPEIGNIIDATDHAAGENPYFASH
jgi:Fe/S biogenesis protein NfuA